MDQRTLRGGRLAGVRTVAAAVTMTAAVLTVVGVAGQAAAAGSNDGRIYFTTDKWGNWELASMRPDGSDVQRITNSAQDDVKPDAHIASDGSVRLVFVAGDLNARVLHIATMTVGDPTSYRQLSDTEPGHQWSPEWSPDGTQIVYSSNQTGNWEIWVMNADGTNQHQITNNPAQDEYEAWSPDGTTIAFGSDRDGIRNRATGIYLMNPDGSNVRRVTRLTSMDAVPAFSPDGTKLAWVDSVCDNGGCGPSHVYVGNLDGTGIRRLTQGDNNDWNPVFSPDGTKVAFHTSAIHDFLLHGDDYIDIGVANVDGSGWKDITGPNGAISEAAPTWK